MKWLNIAKKLDGKQLKANLITTVIHNKMIGLLILLSTISIYALYILLTIQGSSSSNQSINDILYRAGIMNIGVFSFITIIFIYFTKNKLLNSKYKHFFSSLSLSPLEIVLANYYYVFIFVCLFFSFVMLPVFLTIIFFYKITFFMLLSIFLMWISLPLMFSFILNIWIISYIIISKTTTSFKNSFLTILFISVSFFLIYSNLVSSNKLSLLNLYLNLDMFNYSHSIFLIFLYTILNFVCLRKISAIYLGNLFKEKLEDGFSKYKSINILKWKKNCQLLIQIKLELLKFNRTNLYVEQIFIVIFLSLIIIVTYKTVNFENFISIYNLIFQFGIIEAMIIVLISLGSEFLKNKASLYVLNWDGYNYIFSKFLLYSLINILIYILFVSGISLIVSDINIDLLVSFQYIRVISITILAITIGFVWPVQEFNRLFLILIFIFCYGIIEQIIFNLSFPNIVVNMIYGVLIPCSCILFLKKKFLKGPIMK